MTDDMQTDHSLVTSVANITFPGNVGDGVCDGCGDGEDI